jgi:hypothetical protein
VAHHSKCLPVPLAFDFKWAGKPCLLPCRLPLIALDLVIARNKTQAGPNRHQLTVFLPVVIRRTLFPNLYSSIN